MRRSGRGSTLFRLTVARRRRLFHVCPSVAEVNAPSSRARSPRWLWGADGPLCVIQVPQPEPRRSSESWNGCLFCRRHIHTRTARRAELHGERRLKNLFEQFALEDGRRRSNAKTLALLKKSDLVSVLARKIEFVRDHDNRVAVG